jgi:hypothetical protein
LNAGPLDSVLTLWQDGVMPKRISKKLKDPNQIATAIVALSTAEEPPTDRETLSRVMAEMGRKGGRIGGKRSLETMSAADRKKRAKKAAIKRWSKNKK